MRIPFIEKFFKKEEVMTTSASPILKHNIEIGQILISDDPSKDVALFPGKKNEEFFTRAYKRDGTFVLVSDKDYNGAGLIVFLNDNNGQLKGKKIKITNILPNVVFGQWEM